MILSTHVRVGYLLGWERSIYNQPCPTFQKIWLDSHFLYRVCLFLWVVGLYLLPYSMLCFVSAGLSRIRAGIDLAAREEIVTLQLSLNHCI